ncbi:hypothetical protein OSTOST_19532 [Ostertagia ostertagi]
MSEELLRKFLDDIEEEDGLIKKAKQKTVKAGVARDEHIKRILVELPPEESYIVERRKRHESFEFDDRLAQQGFSLIEQARAQRPADLLQRNLKYMKYTDKKRKLDKNKAKKIVLEHMRKKTSKRPKNEKKKDESVFSDADFAVVGKKKKKLEKIPVEYL